MQEIEKSERFPGREFTRSGSLHRYRAFDEGLAAEGYYWTFCEGYRSGTVIRSQRFIAQIEENMITFFLEGGSAESFRYPEKGISLERKIAFCEKVIKNHEPKELAERLKQYRKVRQYGRYVLVAVDKDLYDCIDERF